MHGKIFHPLHDSCTEFLAWVKWLPDGDLYAETEGFMLAIQDEVIPTPNYQVQKD